MYQPYFLVLTLRPDITAIPLNSSTTEETPV